MGTILTLFDLEEGQTAKITDILVTGTMRRRLLDLGITQGTRIQCLYKSPSKDPVAFLIRGTVIALRSEDSRDIIIAKID